MSVWKDARFAMRRQSLLLPDLMARAQTNKADATGQEAVRLHDGQIGCAFFELPCPANTARPTRDKLTRRANHEIPVQPSGQKYSAGAVGQISDLTPRVSRRMRGVGHRHERAVRCGGRRWRTRRRRRTRTAKSCGPDAAVLASSCARARASRSDGGKRAVHRGEHEASRKATAQGMPECSDCTCMLVCATLRALLHTRPRVQQAPGIPCALFTLGETICRARAKRAAGTRKCVSMQEGFRSKDFNASGWRPAECCR